MSKGKYILQISSPCQENWHIMTPDGQGRFCGHCSKSVIDFTHLSDEQIVALLEQQKGNLCGRFQSTQLNRVLIKPRPVQSQNRLRKFIAAILLLFTARDVVANEPQLSKAAFTQSPDPSKGINDSIAKDTTEVQELSGRVVNSFNSPIPFANVINKTTHTGKTTDFDGNFKIDASLGDTISVTYLGFESIKFVLRNFEFKDYQLKLEDSEDIMFHTLGRIDFTNYRKTK